MGSIRLETKIKDMAKNLGFYAVGITSPNNMKDLHYGWVKDVKELQNPNDVLPETKSVIMLVLHAWDKSFFTQIDPPEWKGYDMHEPGEVRDGYYVTYQVSMNKAWHIVSMLREKGHKAEITTSIPFKMTSVKCGLGNSGKSTLFIHPEIGPRVGLMAILTDTELEPDTPFTEDLCGDCTRCIDACPTRALSPHNITIERCLAHASENPGKPNISEEIRGMEDILVRRPTANSYLECTICMDACPIGRDKL